MVTETTAEPATALAGQMRFVRIQEAADETGLTPRAIRYYEELGLLAPAARSEGDYRLFDEEDLERLRVIRGLRDDARFSLAEIRQLLEDEEARARLRARFDAATGQVERREVLEAAIAQVDHRIEILRGRIARLQELVRDARSRRAHLVDHLEAVETGREMQPHSHPRSRR